MNKFNSIYLRRSNKLILTRGNSKLDAIDLAKVLKDIEFWGYTLSPQLIECLSTLSLSEARLFYSQLVKDLKQAVGGNVNHAPMYPNFPRQVMSMADAELYLNAMMHYLGRVLGARILPQYIKESRPPLADKLQLKVIQLGTESELLGIFRNLLAANTALSPTDKQDLEEFITSFSEFTVEILPEQFNYKENLAFIAGLLLRHHDAAEQLLVPYFRTATDVLRLATAMSDGDLSLAENTRFRNFSRRERRFILGLLEQCGSIVEDMLRYKQRWIRLGERLHPGEYQQRYPKCYQGFDILRNNKPVATFNSRLEAAFLDQRWQDAVDLLQTRPGELARRLDFLLRNMQDQVAVKSFQQVSARIATPVLLQVANHFQHRNESLELRVFFPKGNVAKAFAIQNELPAIAPALCQQVVAICEQTLVNRFGQLPDLGKVYIDPELKNFPIPFAQRSASKSLRQLTRGSRLPIAEGDTIRFFIWWQEGIVNGMATGTVDIDLSAVMYDADWNYLEHISYTNLKSGKYQAAHSGDITSAPNGASEFIDLDLPSILKYGGRYVVASVLSYSRQPFSQLPQCFAGWMIRQHAASGEIYEPQTVQDKLDLTAHSTVSIPGILDLQQREIIWTDMSLTSNPSWQGIANNVENRRKGMVLIGKAMTGLHKPTLAQLFKLHGQARGEIINQPELADTVFSVTQGITPFAVDAIAAEFLV